MPALFGSALLAKRQDNNFDNNNGCPNGWVESGGWCYDPWNLYGRWILLGGIIVGAFLLFCVFSCITARRRRRLGQQPIRGTGWAAGGPAPPYNAQGYGAPQQYYGGQAAPQGWQQQPPPQYGAPDQSHYGKSNPEPYGAGAGGYGQQSGSVELQSPGHSYQRGGDSVYNPPPGPPPGKGDGIIR